MTVGTQSKILDQKEAKKLTHEFKAQTLKLGELVSSEYGVGVMADRAVHTGEGGTRLKAASALLTFFKANPNADFTDSNQRNQAGEAIINALASIDKTRASTFSSLNKDADSFKP